MVFICLIVYLFNRLYVESLTSLAREVAHFVRSRRRIYRPSVLPSERSERLLVFTFQFTP